MGAITESFANLNDYLLAEQKKSQKHSTEVNLVSEKLLKAFLPSGMRSGMGTLVDIKDRQAGPLDLVAGIETLPPFGDGASSLYAADGAVFCLQVKNWAESDLSQFGELAANIKKLERKKNNPIPCLAVSFGLVPLPELESFLQSQSGQAIDGMLCVGHHLILRNSLGWYGDPALVPFVTERPGPEALKAFVFFLIQLSQTALGIPFGLADYQHL